jgi:predicted AlkP superfamily phosphohydrolase/phosphomutase
MAARKRVLIIGLDGFTWDLGNRFISEGIMPNLSKMIENGCHGNLRSVMPFETSPAWSSFQTGCFPGKTRIFAFHAYDRKENILKLNSLANNKMPSLWELADRKGKTVVSLNMPVSSPPPKVKGVIIPGLLCPQLSRQTVHPPEAFDKYIKPNKDYFIINNDLRETVRETAEQSISTEKARCRTALELIKDIDWDIFFVQIQSTDLMQHRTWHGLDPEAKGHTPQERKEALKFYRACDKILEQIIEAAGKDVLTVIVSDHGFGVSKYSISINVWLKQHGYLSLLADPPEPIWTTIKKKVPPLKALAALYGNIRKMLKKRGSTPIFGLIDLEHMRRVIDFDKTKALCVGGMAGILYITDKNNRKALAETIRQELLGDFGPESKNPAIKNIRSGQEVYGSENTSDAMPDLVIEYFEGYESKRDPKGDEIIRKKGMNNKDVGTHRRNGVFIFSGPGVKQGSTFDGDIVDIAPTVMAYLGLSVPRHFDGKVLNSAFAEPLPVDYENITFDRSETVQYSDEEQAKVEQQLSDLGYL